MRENYKSLLDVIFKSKCSSHFATVLGINQHNIQIGSLFPSESKKSNKHETTPREMRNVTYSQDSWKRDSFQVVNVNENPSATLCANFLNFVDKQ